MGIETGDSVTFEYTGRLEDGVVFDTSREPIAEESGLTDVHQDREYAPLTVEIGEGRVIEGLEEALVGMDEGETATVTIPPEKGYGQPSDEHVREYDADEFIQLLQGEDPEEGMHVQTQQGGFGEIVHVGDDVIRVDFNHELAGETLTFDLEIVDVN